MYVLLVYYEVIDGSSDRLIDWLESEPDPYEHYTMHCFLSIVVVLMNVAWSLARATISPDHISVHGKENFSPDSSSSGPNTDPRYGSALISIQAPAMMSWPRSTTYDGREEHLSGTSSTRALFSAIRPSCRSYKVSAMRSTRASDEDLH